MSGAAVGLGTNAAAPDFVGVDEELRRSPFWWSLGVTSLLELLLLLLLLLLEEEDDDDDDEEEEEEEDDEEEEPDPGFRLVVVELAALLPVAFASSLEDPPLSISSLFICWAYYLVLKHYTTNGGWEQQLFHIPMEKTTTQVRIRVVFPMILLRERHDQAMSRV